jgi:plastocyanin
MSHGRIVRSTIRGARKITAIAIAASLLGGCASRGSIVGRVRPASPDVVVMAWRVDGRTPKAPTDTARVVQAHGRFEPRMLVIQSGTTVEFANRDRVYHNAFSIAPGTKFDLGRYRPGQARRSSFDQAGAFQVFCELHPKESLYIVVVPDRWHTRPIADGTFILSSVPRGEYMLRAWHPTRGQVTTQVVVPMREPALLRLGG